MIHLCSLQLHNEKMHRVKFSCELFFLQLLLLSLRSCAKLCSQDQSSALLQFKQLFSFQNDYPDSCDDMQQSKVMSWKEEDDCCSWDGVTCDMVNGHVIGLDLSCSWLYGNIPSNSSLFSIPHLQKLNLAYNNFNFSQISSSFSNFHGLTHLNLSFSNFGGALPYEISTLSKLVSLDLSLNFQVSLETLVWEGLVQNLTNLKELILNYVDMSSILPGSFTNLTSSLTSLSLEDCFLQGDFPENIFQLPNLQTLVLAHNRDLVPRLFPNVNWSIPLRFLDLTGSNFTGLIPASIGNLALLSYLDFSDNQLIGPIPSSVSGLKSLASIHMSFNSLSGIIPVSLFTLPLLEYIDLSNNQLSGSIPSSIFELANLSYLQLSSNNLSGTLDLSMFAQLKNFTFLDLSHNRLSLTSTLILNSSFTKNLLKIRLSACNLSEFPDILRGQDQLKEIILSNNKIHGRVPDWMWNTAKETLSYLDLSHNSLTGIIEHLPWKNLEYLDLSFNLLQGSLVVLPPSVGFFSVSNNRLTGEIPSPFCNLSFIDFLDLSNNNFSGTIPENLGNSSRLLVLFLQNNNFYGSIPQSFAHGSRLAILNLNGNLLEGPLPPSLVNCRSLQVLDVGNNMINDTFPYWLTDILELQVLILRSNKFHGPIDNFRTPFRRLRILDLSYNQFEGVLPTRFFQNFEAMMQGENNSVKGQYMKPPIGGEYYSVSLNVKGTEILMEKILTIFTAIDLSSNRLQGKIPEVVGKLNLLKGLNFSHNNLTGHIPSLLANLTQLESLDLSSNKLVGKIPSELTRLNFLQVLNLSENQLVGRIPRENHFDTFPNDSYSGNLGLCGFPLSEKCGDDKAPKQGPARVHEEDDTSSLFNWKFAFMGYASGLVIGVSLGYMVLAAGRPQWFFRMIEEMQSKKKRTIRRGRARKINKSR